MCSSAAKTKQHFPQQPSIEETFILVLLFGMRFLTHLGAHSLNRKNSA
jgi:hypothetical protein